MRVHLRCRQHTPSLPPARRQHHTALIVLLPACASPSKSRIHKEDVMDPPLLRSPHIETVDSPNILSLCSLIRTTTSHSKSSCIRLNSYTFSSQLVGALNTAGRRRVGHRGMGPLRCWASHRWAPARLRFSYSRRYGDALHCGRQALPSGSDGGRGDLAWSPLPHLELLSLLSRATESWLSTRYGSRFPINATGSQM